MEQQQKRMPKSLMVEDAKFKVKECVHVVNLLKLEILCETNSSYSI